MTDQPNVEGYEVAEEETSYSPINTLKKDNLEIEGYEQVEEIKKKVSDAPEIEGYEQVDEDFEEFKYVPEMLKGHKLEYDWPFIKNRLMNQGKKGFDKSVYLDKGSVANTLRAFWDVSPEVAALADEMLKTKGVPPQATIRNKKQIQIEREATEIYNTLIHGAKHKDAEGKEFVSFEYPYTANWAIRPERMKLGQQDLAILTKLESEVKRYKGDFADRAKHQLVDNSKGVLGSFVGIYESLQRAKLQSSIEFYEANKHLAKYDPNYEAKHQKYIKDAQEDVNDVSEFKAREFFNPVHMANAGEWEDLALMSIGVAPQVAGMLASAVLGGPKAGAAFIMQHIYGSTYNDLLDKGVMHEDANRLARSNALIQGVLEYIPITKLFKMIKVKGFKRAMKNAVELIVAEAGTEWLQEFPEMAIDVLGQRAVQGNSFNEALDIMVDRLGETNIQGIKAGAAVLPYVLIPGVAKVTYEAGKKFKDHSKELKLYDNEEMLIEQTKIKEMAPLAQEEYLRGLHNQYDVSDVIYLPLSGLNTYYQSDPNGLSDFLADMDIAEQEIKNGNISDLIAVSRSKFLAKYGSSKLSMAIKDKMVFNLNTLTSTEVEALKEDLAEEYEKGKNEYAALMAETQLPDEAVVMRESLINDFKMDQDAADSNMAVFISLAKVMSRRTGESLGQWFSRINPKVVVGGKGPIINMQPDELLTDVLRKIKVGKKQVPVYQMSGKEVLMSDASAGFPIHENAKGEITLLPNVNVTTEDIGGQKGVKLLRFNTAVVPKGLNKKVLDVLKANQIEIIEFDPTKKGAKTRAIKKAEKLNPEIFFQSSKKGKEAKGATVFSEAATYIQLFETADYSTFIHESFHVIMNDMKKMIDSGKSNPEAVDTYAKLVKFAGGQLDTKGIEKLARAFEGYLREGKAPSVELTTPFYRFSQWLKTIYKHIRDLKVKITPEITGVFDRMLASESEIKEAQDYYHSLDNIHDLLDIDYKKKTELKDKKERAKRSAVERQTAKLLKAFLRVVGGREAFKEEATKHVKNMRIFTLIDDVIVKGGLDYNAVMDAKGEEYINQIRALHGNIFSKKKAKEQGLSLIDVALSYGYESEVDMLDDLANTPSFAQNVLAMTDSLIKQRENEILEEVKKNENVEGEESFHNDAELSYQLAVLEVLREKIEKESEKRMNKVELKIIKDAAAQRIGEMPLGMATRYNIFSNAQKRYAKKAVEHMKKGEIVEAYQALKMQAINHAMVSESIKARENRAKIERRYTTKKVRSKIDKMENDYANAVTDMLRFFKVNTKLDASSDPSAIDTIFERDEILSAMVPEWIIKRQLPEEYKSYRDLSYAAFVELDNSLQTIMKYGSDALLALKAGELRTVDSFVKKSIEVMEERKDVEFKAEGTFPRWMQDKLDWAESWVVIENFLADRIDNYSLLKNKEMGPFQKLIDTFQQAEIKFDVVRGDILDSALPDLRNLLDAVSRIESMYGVGNVRSFWHRHFEIKGVPFPDFMKQKGRNRWTAERMVSFLLNLGNEGNTEALLNAYKLSPQQINLISSHFTTKELDSIQKIWDAINALYKPLDDVHFSMFNRHLDKVEGRPITLSSSEGVVELKGGYYPLVFDHWLGEKKFEKEEREAYRKDEMLNRDKAVVRTSRPRDGMIYTRDGTTIPPQLSLRVLFNHISDSARYITHAELLRDGNRIIHNKEWAETFNRKAGSNMYNTLQEWLDHVARPERKGNRSTLLNEWSQLASVNILGMNMTVGLKQRLSVFPAIKEIGVKHYYDAVKELGFGLGVAGLKNKTFKELDLLSDGFLSSRSKNYMREISDITDKFDPKSQVFEMHGKKFSRKDLQSAMFWWINMNDMATVAPVYLGAYNKYLAEHKPVDQAEAEKVINQAKDYARRIVSDTQPMSLPTDLSKLQRQDGWLRIFTMFSTWPTKAGNRFIHHTKAWKEGAIGSNEYFKYVAYELLLPPAILTASKVGSAYYLYKTVSGDRPEPEEIAEDLMLDTYDNFVTWMPVINRIRPSMKYNKNIADSPIFDVWMKPIKAGRSWVSDDKDFYDAAWDTARAAEYLYGVPALRTYEDIKKNYDKITGND
jgi:predicted lactoylglutathione lyase